MYPIYRPMARFEYPYKAEDRTFSDARLDDKKIGDANYRHCTFVDASFKQTTLQDCQFLHCTQLFPLNREAAWDMGWRGVEK